MALLARIGDLSKIYFEDFSTSLIFDMQNKTFTTRRGSLEAQKWSRNRNLSESPAKKGLGKVSYTVIVGMLTLIFGLVYISDGTKTTSYDYEISRVQEEITELEARKEDLAVEQDRLMSIAKAKTSEVAANMVETSPSGYISE